MSDISKIAPAVAVCAAIASTAAGAGPAGHITGVGGIFVQSKDPRALMAWYRDTLGIALEPWGGAMLRYDAADHPPALMLNAMPAGDAYFAPSRREVMINFAVDDLPALLAKLRAKGVAVLKEDASDPAGRFAWIMDPDGTKIELYEPKREGK